MTSLLKSQPKVTLGPKSGFLLSAVLLSVGLIGALGVLLFSAADAGTVRLQSPRIGIGVAANAVPLAPQAANIVVSKSPDTQYVLSGGNASFDIEIRNDGDITLTLAVSDPVTENCASGAPLSLAPEESYTDSCSTGVVTSDFVNTIQVTGTHVPTDGSPINVTDSDSATVHVIAPDIAIEKSAVNPFVVFGGTANFNIEIINQGDVTLTLSVSDPTAPNCVSGAPTSLPPGQSETYSCSASNVAEDFTNTIFVTGSFSPPGGGTFTVDDSDTASVSVVQPAISISKDPATQTILYGGQASFTIRVENTGDVGLTSVGVVDSAAPGCSRLIGPLAEGAAVQYGCTRSNVISDFTNSVTVSGQFPPGTAWQDTATADVDVISPSLSIEVTPSQQYLYSDDAASFHIEVINSGDAVISDVAVTAPEATGCESQIGTLAPNGRADYDCFRSNVTSSFVNVVSVSGDHAAGGSVAAEDSGDVTVIAPKIAIAKEPQTQEVISGGTASFTIFITNTGDSLLTNVMVSDPRAHNCTVGPLTLQADQSHSYTCEKEGMFEDLLNRATVSGQDPLGREVTSSDTAFVDVLKPGIGADITPQNQTVISGTDASFIVSVINSGAVRLTSVVVTATHVPDCDRNIGTLQASENRVYTCKSLKVSGAIDNLITVSGTTVGSSQIISDSDAAHVDVLGLDIAVSALPDVLPEPGGTLGFNVVASNPGSVDTTLVTLESDPYGDLTKLLDSNCAAGAILSAGGTYSCAFSAGVTGQPGFYDVSVTGTAEHDALSVSDTGATRVVLTDLSSSITSTLTVSPTSVIEPGETVTLVLRIFNLSANDTVFIDGIDDSRLGDLNGPGKCTLPQTIAAGSFYECQYTTHVSGTAGYTQTHTVIASGQDDDDVPLNCVTVNTVTVVARPITNLYLPLTLNNYMVSEPNNSCAEAYPIAINRSHAFLPNDMLDWYRFDLTAAADTTVFLTEFAPNKGQVVVYKGTCGTLQFVASNGNFLPTKTVPLGVQEAGSYYILVVADEGRSTTEQYRLEVEAN